MLNVNKIENRRRRLLLSQKDLAKKIGITVQSYSAGLKKNDFKVSVLVEIAKVLDVPVTYMFNDIGNTQIKGNDINQSINGRAGDSDSKLLKEKIRDLERIIKDKERIITDKQEIIKLLKE